LINMQDRAKTIGASIAINSKTNTGTTIEVTAVV
jgi:signal transduction histidine kinase